MSPQQVTLAWGARPVTLCDPDPRRQAADSITDSAAAADLELTAEEIARLDAA